MAVGNAIRNESAGELPTAMKAIAISEPGGPDVLQAEERALPEIGAKDVLVAVAAAGVNRPDVLQRLGLYPVPETASDLPGLEIAGTVVAKGDAVERWQIGDKVCALTPGGGYAEYCSVPGGHCLPWPESFSAAEAAGLCETLFTVWHNVFQRGALQPGGTFLVHGGTSGIGTMAIQLAKHLGATVFATAGSAEKCRAAEELGAQLCVNYRDEDFVHVLREATGGKGIDVILDMVAGPYVQKNIELAAEDGRIVQIATLNGTKVEVNAGLLMRKRLTWTGSTLRPRSDEFKTALAEEIETRLMDVFAERKAVPLIDRTFPLAEAAEAHRLMESSSHIGKIVLTL